MSEADAGCGGMILGFVIGIVVTAFVMAAVDGKTYKENTVPHIRDYAEAKLMQIPVSLDSEGRIWLWNEKPGISSVIPKEDLHKLVSKEKK